MRPDPAIRINSSPDSVENPPFGAAIGIVRACVDKINTFTQRLLQCGFVMGHAAADPVTSKTRLAYGQSRCPEFADRHRVVISGISFGRICGCISMNHDNFLSKTLVLCLISDYDIHLFIRVKRRDGRL